MKVRRLESSLDLNQEGGYDRMGRPLTKHLHRYIPGRPTLIVEKMPGTAPLPSDLTLRYSNLPFSRIEGLAAVNHEGVSGNERRFI
jgi:hypothetical protein